MHSCALLDDVTLRHDASIVQDLIDRGYASAPASTFDLSPGFKSRWPAFSESWERLEPDAYLPNNGSYRLRRYGRFRISLRSPLPSRLPHRPYIQSAHLNKVAGDVPRQFAPLDPEESTHWVLRRLIQVDFHIASLVLGPEDWHVDVHQIRTTSSPVERGHVVPEGIHQDGMAFIATHLVARHGIRGGSSRIYDLEENQVFETTLETPMDSLYALDDRVLHNVGPISVDKSERIGYRDALLIGFSPFR